VYVCRSCRSFDGKSAALRIKYSHHIFSSQSFGGISNYFIDLASGVASLESGVEMDFPCAVTQNLRNKQIYGGRVLSEKLLLKGVTWRLCHHVNTSFDRAKSQFMSSEKYPSIFHRTYYSSSGNQVGVPEVLTVYDMIHEDYPEFFRKPILKDKVASIERASAIICISNYTRDRLLAHVEVDPKKIFVIPLGIAQAIGQTNKSRTYRGRPYIVYVGRRDGYKNFAVLEKAFSCALETFKDVDLVLLGGGPLNSTELRRCQDLGIENNVRIAATSSDVSILLKEAICVVSTSLSEGFGLVPLEAAALGTPALVSDIDVHREIWGNNLPMFPPTNHEVLTNELMRLLESDSHWEKVSREGLSAAQNLTVRNMARATLDVYRNIALDKK